MTSEQTKIVESSGIKTNDDLKIHIETYFFAQVRKYAIWVVASIVLVGFGGIVATLWDLNGQVYRAVGIAEAKKSNPEINSNIDMIEQKIDLLTKEINSLNILLSTQNKEKTHGN